MKAAILFISSINQLLRKRRNKITFQFNSLNWYYKSKLSDWMEEMKNKLKVCFELTKWRASSRLAGPRKCIELSDERTKWKHFRGGSTAAQQLNQSNQFNKWSLLIDDWWVCCSCCCCCCGCFANSNQSHFSSISSIIEEIEKKSLLICWQQPLRRNETIQSNLIN